VSLDGTVAAAPCRTLRGHYWHQGPTRHPLVSCADPARGPGRYHRNGEPGVWYASNREQGAWAELFRHFVDDGVDPFEVRRRIGRVSVDLEVLDLTEARRFNRRLDQVCVGSDGWREPTFREDCRLDRRALLPLPYRSSTANAHADHSLSQDSLSKTRRQGRSRARDRLRATPTRCAGGGRNLQQTARGRQTASAEVFPVVDPATGDV